MQCVSAVGTIILASLWNFANNQSSNTKALGILDELSYFLAPLGTDYIKAATEEVSIAIKVLADVAANVGTISAYLVAGLDAAGV
jgi:hypothetical protein